MYTDQLLRVLPANDSIYDVQLRIHVCRNTGVSWRNALNDITVVVVVVCGRLTVPSFSWALTSLPGAEFSCSRARVQRRRLCVVCVSSGVCVVAPSASGSPPGRQYSPEALSGWRTADNTVCVCELRYPSLDPRLFTLEIWTGSGPLDLATSLVAATIGPAPIIWCYCA